MKYSIQNRINVDRYLRNDKCTALDWPINLSIKLRRVIVHCTSHQSSRYDFATPSLKLILLDINVENAHLIINISKHLRSNARSENKKKSRHLITEHLERVVLVARPPLILGPFVETCF